MSGSKMISGQHQLETRKCPNCDAVLPPQAQFCGTCGRRVHQAAFFSLPHMANGINDINERYRITSLVRRRPYVRLLMATDTQYQRPVIIRDIDVTSLDEQSRAVALDAIQAEYDQLRHQRIQDVMSLVDLSCFQDHIYSVAEWPSTYINRTQHQRPLPLYTLDDLLQSGIGLPDETEAALWIERLAQAVARLHSQHIILSDLDPYAIIVSSNTYEGIPALMISWLPRVLHDLLPPSPAKAYTSYFYAPETRKDNSTVQSDVYSLGAILYLLLTGTAPVSKIRSKKKQVLRSPRELHSSVSSGIDAIVMHALATEPSARFGSMQEFAEALGDLITAPRTTQQSTHPLISTVFKGKHNTLELPAIRQPKSASPYITRVLKDVPPALPQMSRPTLDPEPASFNESDTVVATQPGPPVSPAPPLQREDTTDISMIPNQQIERLTAIEDIETIIINASEFEAALAQATHHLLISEEDELFAHLANEQQEATQAASAPCDASASTTTIEKRSMIPLKEEIQTHTEIEMPAEYEVNIANIPTVTFKSPGLANAETTQGQQAPMEAIAEAEDELPEQSAQTIPNEAEHEPAAQAVPPLSLEEEEVKTQGTPIENIATQPFRGLAQPITPAQVAAEDSRKQVVDSTIVQQNSSKAEQAFASRVSEVEVEQSPPAEDDYNQDIDEEHPLAHHIKKFFTGPLPAIPRLLPNRVTPGKAPTKTKASRSQAAKNAQHLLKRLRHFVLGQQQHNTSAAALIETPLRIQPDQNYTIRIQIIGSDTPRQQGVGLSGLTQGERVHIEVRSALYHKYAYIVQQADVRLPGQGFAAAVTIPMKPLSDGPSGRRERLHVFFMDEQRNPLYEKPFAIEIFISPLVQPGREGHNVLPIPL